jgi:hypothetical protein
MEEIDLMYKQFIDKLNSKTSNVQLWNALLLYWLFSSSC